ncbi:MAG: hypothetical protein IKI37_03440 [Oscillospiraceae bacterium]|nr:hypothetical protein [Oscillospiraceae bacterium]MBR7084215.1 hypothetical protein [Oscillospiraceae bacterium]
MQTTHDARFDTQKRRGIPIPVPHPPAPPLPPHERHGLLRITFDEIDWKVLKDVFGNEDNAQAAAEIIRNAPPEIQIVILQAMNMIEEVKYHES